MSINRTGFEQTNTGLTIDKDTQAVLTYTLDWNEWLDAGDSIASVTHEVAARRNDPSAMTVVTSGFSGTQSYIKLSGGAEGKVYIVTVKVITANGLTDRRNFRINVLERSA